MNAWDVVRGLLMAKDGEFKGGEYVALAFVFLSILVVGVVLGFLWNSTNK